MAVCECVSFCCLLNVKIQFWFCHAIFHGGVCFYFHVLFFLCTCEKSEISFWNKVFFIRFSHSFMWRVACSMSRVFLSYFVEFFCYANWVHAFFVSLSFVSSVADLQNKRTSSFLFVQQRKKKRSTKYFRIRSICKSTFKVLLIN